MDFDYKKYSLEQLENWVHDAVNGDATPQEIYDVVKNVVDEEYHYHKLHTGRCSELLALLNGNGKGHIPAYDEYKGSTVSSVENHSKYYYEYDRNDINRKNPFKDKVKKWVLPVEECKDADTDETEYFVSFPDDLLEAADLKEGDQVEWVDRGDGSYLLRKVNKVPSWVEGNELSKHKTYNEMIADGWQMTDDGFWIKENY